MTRLAPAGVGTAPARLRLAFGDRGGGHGGRDDRLLVARLLAPRCRCTRPSRRSRRSGSARSSEFGTAEKLFTIVVIIAGVGAVLYTFTLSVQLVAEGWLSDLVGRRRMDRKIADLRGHVVVCGWGRVGRTVADHLRHGG